MKYTIYDKCGEPSFCPPITHGDADCDACKYEQRDYCPYLDYDIVDGNAVRKPEEKVK
jgi:hypothetical protein